MNTNKFAIKFKRYAVLGISLLGLAAMGCGGGSGTLVSDPTFGIPAPATPSLQTTAGAKKSLATISTGSLTVYSLDGAILAPATSVTLPHTVTVDADLKPKASTQGALVVRINNDAGVDYTTVVKLDASDLAANGPIVDADGTSRQEPVDPGSTVRTALIEAELARETGQIVRLGTEASAEVKAALSSVVAGSSSADNAVAVGDIVDSLKAAAAETNSLVTLISQAATTAGTSNNINPQDSIRNFLRTGRTAAGGTSSLSNLKKVRRLMKASTKLARQARKRATNETAVKTLLNDLAGSTVAEANGKAAGAEVVSAALDLAVKSTGLEAQAVALLSKTLDTAADAAATTVLPLLTADVAADLNTKGGSDGIADLLGNVIAGSATGVTAALNTLETVLQVSDANTAKKLFGGSLAATADNTAAAKTLIQNVATDSLSVADAINAVSADIDVADVVDVVADVITDLGNTVIPGLDNLQTIVDGLDVDGEILVSISEQTGLAIADAACIKGFSCSGGTGSLTVKAGDSVSLFNSSIATNAASYSYAWAVAASAGTAVVSTTEYVSFTAAATAGSGNVTLTQSRGGAAISTFTLTVTVQEKLLPVVSLSLKDLFVKQGQSASLIADVFDPESGTLDSSVAVVRCTDNAVVSGLTATNTGESGLVSVDVAATSAVEAGLYCGTFTAARGNYASNETFNVYVEALAPTKLFISGASDVTTGTALPISLDAFSEDLTTTGIVTLMVEDASDNQVGYVTAALSGGLVSVSTTVANLTTGVYQITGTATGATSVQDVYVVNAVGAPSFTSVVVNGLSAVSGGTLEFTTSAGEYLILDIDASASIATGSIVTYTVMSNIAGALDDSSAMYAGTTDGQNISLRLSAGTYEVGVRATSDTGIFADLAFIVTVTETREFAVASVALAGVTTNTLSTSFSGGNYVVDASGVTGLSLSNTGLTFTITGANAPSTALTGNDFTFAVKLETPQADLRKASISVLGGTIAISSAGLAANDSGYDLTAAGNLVFTGKKSDGVTEATYSSPAGSAAITDFANLFTPSANGITVNISGLKDAVKTDVVGSGRNFYNSLDNLTGTGLSVEVEVSAPNFKFVDSNGNKFDTFVINNITVE